MVIIAFDLVNGTNQNRLSFTRNAPRFLDRDDLFGVVQGGVSARVPASLADDTVADISGVGVSPSDTIGVIDSTVTTPVFGVTDTVNPNNSTGADVSAVWTFDISSAMNSLNLDIDIDMAAMGDFEQGSDRFIWTYRIDGGAIQPLFTSSVNEAGSQTYTMESGESVTLDDPLLMNGVVLRDTFQTLTAAIAGRGSVLELTLTANTDGGTEAYVFNNIVIDDGRRDPTLTPIFEIQGSGHTSTFVGQTLETSGIVTAVESNGFYLQDPEGDTNVATSDAIFVFTSSVPTVNVGDEVRVEGTVSEFIPGGASTGNLSTTQIGGSPIITLLSSGNELPAATIIGSGGRVPPTENIDDDAFASFDPDTDGIDFFESLEGMLVTAQAAVAIAPTNQFGEIFALVDNGVGATGRSVDGTLNISPTDFNPERIQIDADTDILPGFSFPQVNVGDSLGNVTGVVSYDFGNFQINPTQAFTVTPGNLPPEVSTITSDGDQLTIASYNVLNLDPNDSDGDADLANGRFAAIAAQIVNNLNSPDIIGLQEIQDNTGAVDDGIVSAVQTLQQLVAAIAAAGGPTYQIIDNSFISNNASGGQPGGNIRTAFLYNPNRVTLNPGSVRSIQNTTQASDPNNPFFGSRLPLVAAFTFNGETITVINNHFSSKGGSAPIFGVEQPFEARQEDPTVNGSLAERQAQAAAVNAFVANLLAADPDANLMVLGDFNEFEFVSPLQTLETNLTNLTNTLPENERYSFIFQGNSQSLDHMLVSNNLASGAQFDIVHVNSEFAETPSRASDHDPLLAALNLDSRNLPPTVSNPLAITVLENQSQTFLNLLQGATDANGDILTVTDFTRTSGTGTGIVRDGDRLRIAPTGLRALADGERLVSTYSYNLSDGNGGVTPQTATVAIAGMPTIFWRNQATGQNVAWFDQGNSQYSTIVGEFLSQDVEANLNWQHVGTGDFNGDQLTDLVWRNQATGQNVVWFMDGSVRLGGAFLPELGDLNWTLGGVADFNNDGQDDLIWRNQVSGQNTVWTLNGTTFSQDIPLTPEADTNWELVGVGNFDGDGIEDDLVWRNRGTGENVVWFMNGAVRESGAFIPIVADLQWQVAGVADFNGDGNSDLLWRRGQTGENVIWYMNGANLAQGVFMRGEADLNWTATV